LVGWLVGVLLRDGFDRINPHITSPVQRSTPHIT